MPIEPSEIFADAATEVAKSIVQESLRDELTTRGFSSVFVSLASETAKSIVGNLVGPLLMALLKVADPTHKKLNRLIAEPLQTGIRSARMALDIHSEEERDARLAYECLTSSLHDLERAYTFSLSSGRVDEGMRIRLVQATVAKTIGAIGFVQLYLREWNDEMKNRERDYKSDLAFQQNEEVKLRSEYPGQQQFAESLLAQILPSTRFEFTHKPSWNKDNLRHYIMYGNDPYERLKTLKMVDKLEIPRLFYCKMFQIGVERKLDEYAAFRRFWAI